MTAHNVVTVLASFSVFFFVILIWTFLAILADARNWANAAGIGTILAVIAAAVFFAVMI